MLGLGFIFAAIGAVVAAGAAIAHKLGSGSYSGSVSDRVDVEEATKDFKQKIKSAAKKEEAKCFSEAMKFFNQLVEALKVDPQFSSVCGIVESKKKETENQLSGTISGYVQKCLSENDSQFEAVLRMNPGKEKEKAVQERIDLILEEAVKEFNKKLCNAVTTLNNDLCSRLDEIAKREKGQLQQKTNAYQDLLCQKSNGSVDLERLKMDYLPVAEINNCIHELFSQTEGFLS